MATLPDVTKAAAACAARRSLKPHSKSASFPTPQKGDNAQCVLQSGTLRAKKMFMWGLENAHKSQVLTPCWGKTKHCLHPASSMSFLGGPKKRSVVLAPCPQVAGKLTPRPRVWEDLVFSLDVGGPEHSSRWARSTWRLLPME